MIETVRLIAEQYGQLPRVRAAALVGSQVLPAERNPSGWNVWILCLRPRPREEAVEALWNGHLCAPLLRGMYAGGGRFRLSGTTVACDAWEIEKVQRCIEQVLEEADPHPDFSASLAGADCPETLCHDVQTCRVLFDRDGCLERWKAQVAVYPPPFRAALLGEALLEARYRLKDLRRGAELGDVPLAHMALSQLSLCLLRMIYAIRERYFPGLKRALAGLDGMSGPPADFAVRLEQLLAAPLRPPLPAERLAQARQLAVDVALQALKLGGEIRQAVVKRGLIDCPDLDPLPLAPPSPAF